MKKVEPRLGLQSSSVQGFVLLLLVLSILVLAGVVVLSGIGIGLSTTQGQIARTGAMNETLVAAKAALLGYVLQTTDGGPGYRLGNLPTPDILNPGPIPVKGTAIEYDGHSDGDVGGANKCLSTTATGLPGVSPGTSSPQSTQRCLGKFPWRTLGLDLGSPSPSDPLGQVPWLAISANLNAGDKCLAKLNSDALSWIWPGAGASCPASPGMLPYPWMTVVDKDGNTLSNRVAAVLIMPGSPIQTGNRTQSRTSARPGYATDYLDAISVPLGCSTTCLTTFDNAALTNTFIQIPAGTRYPINAETASLAGQPVKFNDILIYITIDELMTQIERRVLSEMSAAVRDSKAKTATYPWAAPFSFPANYSSFGSVAGTSFGLFPFINSNVAAYQSDFDWRIESVTALGKKCVPVQTVPDRYVDINENLRSDFYSGSVNRGSASGASSTCLWYDIPTTGVSQFSCSYNYNSTSPNNKSFSVYLDPACTVAAPSGSPKAYDVSRTISVIAEPKCNVANLSVTYQAADVSHTQRMSWKCSNVSAASVFTVNGVDSIATPISPLPQTGSFSVFGTSKSVSLTNVRYQPLMPSWFYYNDWYLTAFYAVAPSKAPSAVTPCGVTLELSSGTNPVDAVVMLSGSRLPIAAPTQIRPSSQLSAYLEQPNLTGATTCSFASSGAAVTNTTNDNVLVVAP